MANKKQTKTCTVTYKGSLVPPELDGTKIVVKVRNNRIVWQIKNK
jgi:hypothetical protein